MAELRDGTHIHFTHSPFTLEHEGVKVECDKDGNITLTQDHEDESFDEIKCSASLIIKLSKMLFNTRNIKIKKEPFRKRV